MVGGHTSQTVRVPARHFKLLPYLTGVCVCVCERYEVARSPERTPYFSSLHVILTTCWTSELARPGDTGAVFEC